jgi:hypothetical protein
LKETAVVFNFETSLVFASTGYALEGLTHSKHALKMLLN